MSQLVLPDLSGSRILTDTMRDMCPVEREQHLPSPRWLRHTCPLSAQATRTVLQARQEIADLLHGRDNKRLLMIVGPCSIHDAEVALEYARVLRRITEK